MIAYLILAAAVQAPPPGVAVSNTVPPQVVLPPHSVPPAAMQPPPAIVRPPQERGSAQHYVTPLDYPAELQGSGAQGTVRFTLTIDPSGRVIGCNVTQSSGSPVLDRATCQLIHRRARYTPAMDSNGNPAVGTIEQEIVWKAR
jgi:protein TonB